MNPRDITREVKEIPVGLIDDPALPSRSSMGDEQMDGLVESIKTIGLQQPIIVYRSGERFNVVAGHRRTVACRRAQLAAVLAIIYPTQDDALDAIQFAENHFREDLSPTDEAIWFTELLERKCGKDIEKLAALVGKKVSYIDSRLALFAGDARVFAALQDGAISIGVAQELNKITDPHYCFHYLDTAIRCGATITVARSYVQEWQTLFGNQPPLPARPSPDGAPIVSVPDEPNRCLICGKADHIHAIRWRPIHTHCELAILQPLLGQTGNTDHD